MALKLTLKPRERFVINGAVVVNGERRSHLLIQNNVSILREKDVMQEGDASTPVRRIYFAIQMLYLDDSNSGAYLQLFERRLDEFLGAIKDREARAQCANILADVQKGSYYRALSTCKKLFPFEEARLNYVPQEDEQDRESPPILQRAALAS
jgi:flagellar biosynthesis repressor protein FlbT